MGGFGPPLPEPGTQGYKNMMAYRKEHQIPTDEEDFVVDPEGVIYINKVPFFRDDMGQLRPLPKGYLDLLYGDGGGGDGASAAAALRGQDLQYQLGLKGIDVDWAKVGLDKQRIAIEQAAQRTNQGSLMEGIRSNKAREAAVARQRALDAASTALSSFLEGSRLADARRLSAFQESRQLLPYLVDPNQKYQAGLAPGGALQQAQERFGLAPSTLGLQKKTLDPRYALEGAPGPRNVGPDVMKYITAVQGAGK